MASSTPTAGEGDDGHDEGEDDGEGEGEGEGGNEGGGEMTVKRIMVSKI